MFLREFLRLYFVWIRVLVEQVGSLFGECCEPGEKCLLLPFVCIIVHNVCLSTSPLEVDVGVEPT